VTKGKIKGKRAGGREGKEREEMVGWERGDGEGGEQRKGRGNGSGPDRVREEIDAPDDCYDVGLPY